MKRFLYSHPQLSLTLFTVIYCIFIFSGILIPLILICCGMEINEGLGWALLLGTPVFGLLLSIFPPAFVGKTEENLNELCQLKLDRKSFHAPTPHSTIENARAYIEQNLEKRLFTKSYCKLHHTNTISCVGVWKKEAVIRYRGELKKTDHPTYYLLYTTDQLEESSWSLLKDVINLQFLELEDECKHHNHGMPAYAVCILCNGAPPTVTQQAHRTQWDPDAKAYLCIGIVPENDWHLSTYKASNAVNEFARNLLGKGTFGLKSAVFPYKGNREYTDAFYQKVDQLCNSRSKK